MSIATAISPELEWIARRAVVFDDVSAKNALREMDQQVASAQTSLPDLLIQALGRFFHDDFDAALELSEHLLSEAGSSTDRTVRAIAELLRAKTLFALNRLDDAVLALESFDPLNADIHVEYQIASFMNLGVVSIGRRAFRDAQVHLLKARELAASVESVVLLAKVDIDLASVSIASGDFVKAIAYLQRALLGLDRVPDRESDAARARANLASLYISTGRLEEALNEYTTLVQLPVVQDSPRLIVPILLNLAITQKRLDMPDQALRSYTETRARAEENDLVMYQIRAMIGITDLHVRSGELDKASEMIKDARRIAEDDARAEMLPEIQAHEANVLHAQGSLAPAIAILTTAYRTVIGASDVSSALLYGTDLAAWHAKNSDYQAAFAIQRECSDFQRQINEQEMDRALTLNQVRSELDQERDVMRSRDEERNRVLHAVMPSNIAQRLMSGERRIADHIDQATILFADMVGFTQMASAIEADEMVEFLEELFTAMDAIASRHGCSRIKTIGDAYMALSEPTDRDPHHAQRMVQAALEMARSSVGPFANINLRIGINSGPIVAGVMSGARLSYDVWGDTVNVASRMEELSSPGRILCTEATASQIRHLPAIALEQREPLNIRGKGLMNTYWVSANVE